MSLNKINEQLERFIDQTKALHRQQGAHIFEFGNILHPLLKDFKELLTESNEELKKYRQAVEEDVNRRRKNLADEQYMTENRLFNDRYSTLLVLAERYLILKDTMHHERLEFQKVINEINRELGEFTHVWGNYAEKCAVESAYSFLFHDYNCLTFLSKVKKTIKSDVKPKTQNIEIDYLAQNEDTVFLVEVKSTLRQEAMRQIIQNMTRLDLFFPQYEGFKKQPIVAYFAEAEEGIADMMFKSGIWLLRPVENTEENAPITFELLSTT